MKQLRIIAPLALFVVTGLTYTAVSTKTPVAEAQPQTQQNTSIAELQKKMAALTDENVALKSKLAAKQKRNVDLKDALDDAIGSRKAELKLFEEELKQLRDSIKLNKKASDLRKFNGSDKERKTPKRWSNQEVYGMLLEK